MKVYVVEHFPDFNCPECGTGLECSCRVVCSTVIDETTCPKCNTKLHLTRRIKYTIRVV